MIRRTDQVLAAREPLVIADAASDERFRDKRSVQRLSIRSVLAAPLAVEGMVVGALYLESRTAHRFFGPEELALFRQILELSSLSLEEFLRQELAEHRAGSLEDSLAEDFPGIVSRDPVLLRVLAKVARVASSDLPVLLQGESGVGKELIAHAVHRHSRRRHQRLLAVNCAAITPSLIESELFGHVKGAFTGATSSKLGLVAAAHEGTLVLDEVGELPPAVQVKLLRTVQFGEVLPVGATQSTRCDVRFVAVTNRDLGREVQEGRFREDLFYRLNAVTLTVPPLRARPGDVELLFRHFVRRAAEREQRRMPPIAPQLDAILAAYPWPGNVRELENEARLAFALAADGQTLTADLLSPRVYGVAATNAATSLPFLEARREAMVAFEKMYLQKLLHEARGRVPEAAGTAGIDRTYLYKLLKKHGLER